MMTKRLPQAMLLAAVVTTVALAGSAGAQTGPIGDRLPEADLHASLKARYSDLKVRVLIDDDDKVVGRLYTFTVTRGKETHRVRLITSAVENKVELLVPLTKRLSQKPADSLLADLKKRSGPAALEVRHHKDDGSYTLLATLKVRRPSTAQALQTQIDDMLGHVEAARPVLADLR
jgi:hypothetical protein